MSTGRPRRADHARRLRRPRARHLHRARFPTIAVAAGGGGRRRIGGAESNRDYSPAIPVAGAVVASRHSGCVVRSPTPLRFLRARAARARRLVAAGSRAVRGRRPCRDRARLRRLLCRPDEALSDDCCSDIPLYAAAQQNSRGPPRHTGDRRSRCRTAFGRVRRDARGFRRRVPTTAPARRSFRRAARLAPSVRPHSLSRFSPDEASRLAGRWHEDTMVRRGASPDGDAGLGGFELFDTVGGGRRAPAAPPARSRSPTHWRRRVLHSPDLAVYSFERRAREARVLQEGLVPNPTLATEVENFARFGGGDGEATQTTVSPEPGAGARR